MNNSTPAGKYDDIIDRTRPVIPNHPPLSIEQRAAQFAPFKTITLYHDSTDTIESQSNHPDTEIIWDEDYVDPAIDSQVSPEDS